MLLKLGLAALVALAGCGGPTASCAFDDGAGPVAAALISRGADFTMVDLVDGGTLPLVAAPQGGVIALVGARVQAVGMCEVTVNAAVRDPASNRVMGLEERPITIDDRGDGWSIPLQPEALASYANVAVCPSAVLPGTVDGAQVHVEVRITGDADATPIELAATLTLACAPGDTLCTCECDPTCGGARDQPLTPQ